MLTPFVIYNRGSFLGTKIGMSLTGSLMAFPAFFLKETFTKKMNSEFKVPALLSAFLITVNPHFHRSSSPSRNFTPPNSNTTPVNTPGRNFATNGGVNDLNQDYSSYGTLIYSGNNIKFTGYPKIFE